MTLQGGWLGWLALVGSSFGISALSLALGVLPGSPLRRAARAYVAMLDQRYARLRLPQHGAGVLVAQIAASAMVAVASVGLALELLAVLPVLGFLPVVLVKHAHARRVARIEQQLDGWLLALANALRAVPSLGEALSASQQLVHAPLSQELDLALKEYRLGASLSLALENMARRMESPVVRSALSILLVARNAGGDLPHTLEEAAASLREMARLEGVVRTKTADGRNQAFVLGALPVVIALVLHTTQPGVMAPLFETQTGHLLLLLAGALWLAAIVLSLRILKVDL